MVAVAAERLPRQGLVAFTYDDIAGLADWRARLDWPIEYARISAIGKAVPGTLLALAGSMADPFERQVAVVGAGLLGNGFMSLLEAAWVSERAEAHAFEVSGGPPEMALLYRGQSRFPVQEYRGPFGVRPVPQAGLRAMARTASWTSLWRLPSALLSPEAVAISHNALLIETARRRRVGFRHAANILVAARERDGTSVAEPMLNIPDRALDRLLTLVPDLREPYRERLRRAFVARLRNTFARIAGDVAALRHAPLPSAVWSGTNGAYATRAIASEVLRRGGSVDVFDHGGATGIFQLAGSTALIELTTSTCFHVATPEWAALLGATEAQALASPVNRAVISGELGEPTFRRAFRDRTARSGPRRRVIYIGHPYRGLRQFPLVSLPDAVYWDFQIDLVEQLKRLPIDLLCKPHPEGHFVGRRNPIEDLAPTSYRRFEEHLDDADVFVFDAPTSTTFLESLCTRRPVVLIDRFYPLNPAVAPHVRARCRIVQATADSRNRLRVDPAELADAVLDAPVEADPTYFRRLTGGSLR